MAPGMCMSMGTGAPASWGVVCIAHRILGRGEVEDTAWCQAGQACCQASCYSRRRLLAARAAMGGYWLPEVALGSARRLDTVEAAAGRALEAPLPLPRVPALGSWRGAVPNVPGGRISTRLTRLADLTRSLLACRGQNQGAAEEGGRALAK